MGTLSYSAGDDAGAGDDPGEDEQPVVVSVVRATPGLVKVAAVSWWRLSSWAATGAVTVGSTVVRRDRKSVV